MRTINIYLRVTEHTTTEVTAQNRPKSQRSYIIRNQPVTLRIGIFRHEAAVALMSKAELEAEGWKTWLLNISKNHTLSYPVYLQPDYDYENPPVSVSAEGIISVVLNTTDTEESAKAIKGMPGDMWEAELTGFSEDDAALETPLAILQWPIGYINRVADENADAPGLLESTYYTKEQVNELLRRYAPTPLMLDEPPTTSTEGVVGQHAFCGNTVYHCVAISNAGTDEEPIYEYTWV